MKKARELLRTTLAIVAAAALVGGAGEALAGAGGAAEKAKTKIVIQQLGANGAKGKIKSREKGCLKKRKISLFVFIDSFRSDKVAITYTNSKGKWKVKRKLEPGAYFAKVEAGKAGRVACLYNNSKTKRF